MNPHVPLLDRRAGARLWLLALVLGALLPAVYLTADSPPLLACVLAVWLAATGVVGVWAVRDLALPDPSSLPRPVTGADLLTSVSTMRVEAVRPASGIYSDRETALGEQLGVLRVGAHSVRALAESDTPTGVIPQVQA